MEKKASLENSIIVFLSILFIMFYFLPGFSFQSLISFIESIVSSGNPVTNLNIIFITMGVVSLIAIVRLLIHLITIFIQAPLPPYYWMYGSSSSDD